MKFTKALLSAACAVVLFSGCAMDKRAIVTVNGDPVTHAEYGKVMDMVKKNPGFEQAPPEMKKDNSPNMLMLKGRIIQDLITKKILEQEFTKREITATEEEISAKKKEIAQSVGGEENFAKVLKERGVSEKQINEDVANEIKVNKLLDQTANIKISDKEIKEFYNNNKESFNFPQRVKASHILIEANPEMIRKSIIDADKDGKMTAAEIDAKVKEALDKKMALAKEVREKAVKNPKDFAKLANEYSDDKMSAIKGGDLGFFPKEAMVKEFSDAAFAMKPNTISQVVVTQFGNHIIMVTDRAAAGLAPYEQVKGEIEAYLTQTRKVAALQALFEGLKAAARIEYRDKRFSPDGIQEAIKKANEKMKKEMPQPQQPPVKE